MNTIFSSIRVSEAETRLVTAIYPLSTLSGIGEELLP